MNKRGGDKIISVYWFVIIFIIAAAIAYMVITFYGKPYDIRELEANALTNKVADCISQGGYARDDLLTAEFKNSFLVNCNLNFNVEDEYAWKQEEQYYVEVEILDINSKNKVGEMSAGNVNLKEFCEIEGGKLPFCVERSFYSISKQNTQYQINIWSVVRKTEKNG